MATISCTHVHWDGLQCGHSSLARTCPLWIRANEETDWPELVSDARSVVYHRRSVVCSKLKVCDLNV